MLRWLKHFFIPHAGNNYRPTSLKQTTTTVLLIVVMVLVLGAIVVIAIPELSSKLGLASVLPSVLIAKTNETRTTEGITQLIENPLLTHAAQLKANDMAARGYFSHVDPDGNQPWHYLTLAGYSYAAAGENLAVNFSDSVEVHRAWMRSPTHKANIIRPQFSEIGIGIATGTYKNREVMFVVQFFGVPKSTNTLLARTPTATTTDSVATGTLAVRDTTIPSQVQGAVTFNKPTLWEFIKSAPRTTSMYTLIAIGVLVAMSLVLKVAIARHIQYNDLIVSGILLLIIVITGFFINYMLSAYIGEISGDYTARLIDFS